MSEKIEKLLQQILEETKKQTQALEEVKNLFIKYDMEAFMEDEEVRNDLR
jgi:hypothetical protein